ncbi:curved DNA-binding protein [Alteromonadaceae bacterium Bs31]|nr:curved DNA-binding protein [Alteromonadaceae bacterium Bs31]
MEFKDYYKILGVEPDVDAKAIKTAYRKLARKYHPDMNLQAGAEEKFKEISEAYQVLKNKKLRSEFDELRQYQGKAQHGFQPPPGWSASHHSSTRGSEAFNGEFSEFFNSIFGGRTQSFDSSEYGQPRSGQRGQDIEVELPIFLEETLNDCHKSVEFIIPADRYTQTQAYKKHLKVKVPQGVMDGERIRLKGQGKPGHNGAMAGDLYLHVRVVPHPLFDVHGHNISITIPLAPWEAALGTRVSVPTLAGKINLTIPPDSQTGDKLRVKGKGLKTKKQSGDMYAVVKVTMPKETSATGKRLWQELAASEDFNPRQEWSA